MNKTTRYLAIDVGGTNLKYGLMDESGNIIQKSRIETPRSNLSCFIDSVTEIVQNMQCELSGIAFSTPGRVDPDTDVIYFHDSTIPYLDKVCLPAKLKKFNIPITVENDGKSAAIAESWLGNLKNVNNGAAIVLGTCVGGGLILDKHLWYGTNHLAGEITYMLTDPNKYDNEELYGLSCSAVKMITKINTIMGNPDLTNGEQAFEGIKSGDQQIKLVFESFCNKVASLIFNIQTVLDLQKYVIGGGISFQDILIDEINNQLDYSLQKRPWPASIIQRPEITACKFHNDTNLYGALYCLLNKLDITHEVKL